MASGDYILDAAGNHKMDASGNWMLDDGAGNDCPCGCGGGPDPCVDPTPAGSGCICYCISPAALFQVTSQFGIDGDGKLGGLFGNTSPKAVPDDAWAMAGGPWPAASNGRFDFYGNPNCGISHISAEFISTDPFGAGKVWIVTWSMFVGDIGHSDGSYGWIFNIGVWHRPDDGSPLQGEQDGVPAAPFTSVGSGYQWNQTNAILPSEYFSSTIDVTVPGLGTGTVSFELTNWEGCCTQAIWKQESHCGVLGSVTKVDQYCVLTSNAQTMPFTLAPCLSSCGKHVFIAYTNVCDSPGANPPEPTALSIDPHSFTLYDQRWRHRVTYTCGTGYGLVMYAGWDLVPTGTVTPSTGSPSNPNNWTIIAGPTDGGFTLEWTDIGSPPVCCDHSDPGENTPPEAPSGLPTGVSYKKRYRYLQAFTCNDPRDGGGTWGSVDGGTLISCGLTCSVADWAHYDSPDANTVRYAKYICVDDLATPTAPAAYQTPGSTTAPTEANCNPAGCDCTVDAFCYDGAFLQIHAQYIYSTGSGAALITMDNGGDGQFWGYSDSLPGACDGTTYPCIAGAYIQCGTDPGDGVTTIWLIAFAVVTNGGDDEFIYYFSVPCQDCPPLTGWTYRPDLSSPDPDLTSTPSIFLTTL